ncbi:hypothetical protein HY383_00330 [Candidatus Daviesbacteria bacterium]|nr:hypothetical protein [Candidatus Daviesbacteria bacterium]
MIKESSLGFSRILVVIVVFFLLLIGFLLVRSGKFTLNFTSADPFKVYTNTEYGYSIKYPRDWEVREFDSKRGAAFRPVNKPNNPSFEYINIDEIDKIPDLVNRPLEEYAKVAATKEFQNYKRLNSFTRVTSKTGLVGYQTTWKVTPLGGGEETISGPITYFDVSNMRTTIQIKLTNYDYLDLYHEMLQTLSVQLM